MYMGVDPGKTGGWAIIRPDNSVYAINAFTSFSDIKNIINKVYKDITGKLFTVIENVHSFPGQGVKSMFSFGQNYGGWQATMELLELPYELIPPKEWQKDILGTFPKGESKKRALLFAQKRWPEITLKKKDHGIIDALCIALYAKRLDTQIKNENPL